MAKGTKEKTSKLNFGVKKKGMAKRKFGPKEQRPKSYKGQGR